MDTQQSLAGSATGTFQATEPSKAKIKTQSIRLLASGLMGQLSSKEPLVSLRKSGDFQDCYDVNLHMYLPDHARNVHLDENISDCGVIEIWNGPIEVRDINIIYDNPAGHPEIYAYSLWEIKFRYCVEGREMPAIRVRYVIGDPETTNGTVTSVEKT
ncbi:hypothetical protein [Chitinophaga filiformis]|uniref:Uncharacterized protein n=1 Tax=Chitinophaga filiformis TaxID=104663 RepID=A0ABY4IAH4_CHIFI|nr:hypothetical protein [Chitinophaga filiformis]UPK72540.1 hypothetical protein MYF79_14705 [Chitinophaga filiformis]